MDGECGMKYGICTTMDHYRDLCALGYDYIELPGTGVRQMSPAQVRETAAVLQDGGKPCLGFNAYCGGDLPIVGEGYRKGPTYNYARELCEKGAELGIKSIGIGAPKARRLPLDYDPARADAQCREFLAVTAGVAAEYGITVLLEALNHTMCEYLLDTVAAWKMVKELGMDNLKLVLDFYQAAMEGEEPEKLSSVLPEVRHLHISGYEPDGSRYHLREKDIPFCTKYVTWAQRMGYDGTISVEADSDRFLTDARDSLDILRVVTGSEQRGASSTKNT